jgi:hypothetical protein
MRCTAFLILIVPLVARGQGDGVLLRGKLEPGKTFYQVTTSETTQVLTLLGNKLKQVQKQTHVARWTPVARDKRGIWTVRFQIVGLKADIDMDGNRIHFDSANPAPS